MADSPFNFGVLVSGDEFIDREKDIKRLQDDFRSHVNIMLISPRRWGKSSLVRQAATTFKPDEAVRFVFIDLFNITSETEFYAKYASAVINATYSKLEEAVSGIKDFFKKIVPQITFFENGLEAGGISLNWRDEVPTDEVLDLPEKIAQKKKQHILVCIDEFQNISSFTSTIELQKRLRSHWQQHRFTRYCLYGSKRHLLHEFFNSSSMPFYKFGDVIFLDKIDSPHWIAYIVRQFQRTGKEISDLTASQIAADMDCHPYFVQQFAFYVWLATPRTADEKVLAKAREEMLRHNQMFYQRLIEELPISHIQFLKALANGEKELTSKDTLEKYNLGTSANVVKIKNSLGNREVIDNWNKYPEFTDPLFRLWFRKTYNLL